MTDSFRALVLRETEGGRYAARLEQLMIDDLPAGEVLVAVDYSDLNYKDGLAVTGRGKIAPYWFISFLWFIQFLWLT